MANQNWIEQLASIVERLDEVVPLMGGEIEFASSSDATGITANRVGCARLGVELLRAAMVERTALGSGGVVERLNYEALNGPSGLPAVEVIRIIETGAT